MLCKQFSLFLLSILILFSSCEIINPEEDIPSYINIKSVELKNNPDSFGTGSHKITDAWIYVDDELIGAFELPARVPVLKSGEKKLLIRAGIKLNGIAATRVSYPFFTNYEIPVDLSEKNVTEIQPVFRYNSTVKLPLNENFESNSLLFEETSKSDTVLKKTTDPQNVFEGTTSGAIFLDADKPTYEGRSFDMFTLPKGGNPVFVELNYKCNNVFVVGIIAYTSTYEVTKPVIIINPTNGVWNKIYINLTTAVSEEVNAFKFRLLLHSTKADDVSNPEIYLDNIKLIHQ